MTRTIATLLAGVPLLASCATAGQGEATAPVCRPKAAAMLVGSVAPGDARVKRRTGATLIRRIAPGDMVTQDFRENRITLTIDRAGKVVDSRCG